MRTPTRVARDAALDPVVSSLVTLAHARTATTRPAPLTYPGVSALAMTRPVETLHPDTACSDVFARFERASEEASAAHRWRDGDARATLRPRGRDGRAGAHHGEYLTTERPALPGKSLHVTTQFDARAQARRRRRSPSRRPFQSIRSFRRASNASS